MRVGVAVRAEVIFAFVQGPRLNDRKVKTKVRKWAAGYDWIQKTVRSRPAVARYFNLALGVPFVGR